jgi:S1-C subfamily serine protease
MKLHLLAFGAGALLLYGAQVAAYQKSPVEKLTGATIKLEANLEWGSGTVISSKFEKGRYTTLILTNQHVVEDNKTVIIHSYRFVGDKVVAESKDDAVVLFADEGKDLALVQLNRGDEFPNVAKLGEDPHPLDYVIQVGAALGRDPIITEGIVSGYADNKIRESADITPGDSGGSLYDKSWHLVGVPEQVAVLPLGFIGVPQPHMAYAIPVSTVKAFLKEHKVTL